MGMRASLMHICCLCVYAQAELAAGAEAGVLVSLIMEGRKALLAGTATGLEARLRAAIEAREPRELYTAVKEAKRAAERRDGSAPPQSVVREAEGVLMIARRVADKLKMVETALQMSGLREIERAIHAARSDSNVPRDAVARAEAELARRTREQKYWRWLEALRTAQAKMGGPPALGMNATCWPQGRIPDWDCPQCRQGTTHCRHATVFRPSRTHTTALPLRHTPPPHASPRRPPVLPEPAASGTVGRWTSVRCARG